MNLPASGALYGFQGRLSPVFPSQVVVDITEVCNLACIHCPHPSFKKSEYYEGRFLEAELNRKMVDEVRNQGKGRVEYIRYTSEGEPLAHPKGYEFIEYAVRHSGTYVTLTTNGTIMNEVRTKRLLEGGVHLIDISIDAFTPETYARIRVGGNLEVTRGNVLRLLRWVKESGSPTKVVVSFIKQPLNQRETQLFERYWKEQGADFVVIRELHSAAGAIEPYAQELRHQVEARRPCLYPWERIVLNPRGELSFCPADWTHGATICDYRTTTIRDTWQGPFYEGLRSAHLTGQFECHGFCGQCPDWRFTHWPGEGRRYADMVEQMKGDTP